MSAEHLAESGIEQQLTSNPQAEEETDGDNNNNRSEPLGQISENTSKEVLAGLLSGISICASITAMVMTSSALVTVAGVFACVIGPYSYWQQRNLTDVLALKKTHTALVKEIEHLKSENERLKGLVGELGDTVTRFEEVEESLDFINEMNIESIDEFRIQVDTAKSILELMKENLKANVLQNVITVVLHSDQNRDFRFDSQEVDILINNLKSINGITINEQRLRTKIANISGDLNGVITIMRDVMNTQANNKESFIMYKPN